MQSVSARRKGWLERAAGLPRRSRHTVAPIGLRPYLLEFANQPVTDHTTLIAKGMVGRRYRNRSANNILASEWLGWSDKTREISSVRPMYW